LRWGARWVRWRVLAVRPLLPPAVRFAAQAHGGAPETFWRLRVCGAAESERDAGKFLQRPYGTGAGEGPGAGEARVGGSALTLAASRLDLSRERARYKVAKRDRDLLSGERDAGKFLQRPYGTGAGEGPGAGEARVGGSALTLAASRLDLSRERARYRVAKRDKDPMDRRTVRWPLGGLKGRLCATTIVGGRRAKIFNTSPALPPTPAPIMPVTTMM